MVKPRDRSGHGFVTVGAMRAQFTKHLVAAAGRVAGDR
jgi:hypothetical protein